MEAADGMTFITSDCPVVTMRIDTNFMVDLGHGFGKADVAVALPLNPNKIWVASPTSMKWPKKLDKHDTGLFNKAIAQFADKKIIARTQDEAFDELAKTELGKVVFGLNAFIKQEGGWCSRTD